MSQAVRFLAVFDYDHTIVQENTDIVVRDLIDSSVIPNEVKQLYRSSGWINYMQAIFDLLHKHGKTKDQIHEAIRSIPETPGMKQCMKKLTDNAFEVIVISDSNSVFIDTWNRDHRIADYISTIFTNPARFDANGHLCLQPYHHQEYCSISSENLCKGQIMEDFIAERKANGQSYDSVFYIGDGRNDICPMLRLGEADFACPRVGFLCEKELENVARKLSKDVRSTVFRWNDGYDLATFMLQSASEASSQ